MKVAQGKKYDNEEGMTLDMELVDLRAEKSVVTMKVRYKYSRKDLFKTHTCPVGIHI